MLATADQLRFKVAPHLVQDLGLNLYTSLGKVLVEFVANAHDADSPHVDIRMDFARIDSERKRMSAQWKLDQTSASLPGASPTPLTPLGERVLPSDVSIEIEDQGTGMSREDFQERFLVAGRRRREEDPEEMRLRTPIKKRLLMGRKGVGKLAGFGVAHKITIVSRKLGEAHATKIVLDYNELRAKRSTDDFAIPDERLEDGGGISPSGTRITLTQLLHEPTQNRVDTVSRTLGDHFYLIKPEDFAIRVNGAQVKPTSRELDYAWPKPEVPVSELVEHTYATEDGFQVSFKYRIRFTERGKMLPAKERGVRVYAHNRLAAMPSLLNAGTNMHGFRMTDYMDGIVVADFLDDLSSDYISTDRQTLRWETSLLSPLLEHLSSEMKSACSACQKKRELDMAAGAKKDAFTATEIERAGLPKHREKALYKAAAAIAAVCTDGMDGEEYKTRLPILVDGFAQGDILKALGELSKQEHPDLQAVVAEITELSYQEFGDFGRYITGRLDGISALDKILARQDFKDAKKENELHQLLEKNPWLIDPTFTQFLTSNQSEDTVFAQLAKKLKVDDACERPDVKSKKSILKKWSSERPDLVFLLGSEGLGRLIIVELKAPNVPLNMDHLLQLRGYMLRAATWLKTKMNREYIVDGILIGCHDPDSRTEKIMLLNEEMRRMGPHSRERVFDIAEVLALTKRAHETLLKIYKKAEDSYQA